MALHSISAGTTEEITAASSVWMWGIEGQNTALVTLTPAGG